VLVSLVLFLSSHPPWPCLQVASAGFPCTLVVKRIRVVSDAVKANRDAAARLKEAPKPLFRGLRVRVGCFTGAPEVRSIQGDRGS